MRVYYIEARAGATQEGVDNGARAGRERDDVDHQLEHTAYCIQQQQQ